MEKSDTLLKILFSLSWEHTILNTMIHSQCRHVYSTTEMYHIGIFLTFSHCRFFLESTLSVWIQSCIVVQLLGKEYMVELKQKIRKGDRILWRIVNLPDICPESPKR